MRFRYENIAFPRGVAVVYPIFVLEQAVFVQDLSMRWACSI